MRRLDQGLDLANYIDPAYQLIVPSRFGYLGTPIPENATVEMQADAHACLLDALGIEQAVVFTSSAGVTRRYNWRWRTRNG
jgi:pimeloyl-ACP methyl ester carboxylesterase